MRSPVLFQKAIEALYSGDTVPDVVLEIGPHQTLVSPIKQVRCVSCRVCLQLLVLMMCLRDATTAQQILNASGKPAAVLPTLKKGAPCSTRFSEAVGKLFELGVQVRAGCGSSYHSTLVYMLSWFETLALHLKP